ncbi:MAG: calcium-binding protein [Clostridiales bacterium]|jgi:hypothetical protein|nr:calcium-binding protein [Clostridiales bacterium]
MHGGGRMLEEDAIRRNRLFAELTDANDAEEVAIRWREYLEGMLSFPFTAKSTYSGSVTVTGLSRRDLCKHEMHVSVERNGGRLDVPLSSIKTVDASESTVKAVSDWHCWVKKGYRFGF